MDSRRKAHAASAPDFRQARAADFLTWRGAQACFTVRALTVSGNLGVGIGIVTYADTADFEYPNTIFADNGNASLVALGTALAGLSITLPGNNLRDDSPAGDAARDAATGDLRDTDPLLAPLADYGGATYTTRPVSGSPAFDPGLCFADDPLVPEDDQRGVSRPQGEGGDIGAVELAQIGVLFEANGGAPAPGGQVMLEGDLSIEPTPFDAVQLFGRWTSDALFSDGFEQHVGGVAQTPGGGNSSGLALDPFLFPGSFS